MEEYFKHINMWNIEKVGCSTNVTTTTKTIPSPGITSPRAIEPTIQKEPISIDFFSCTKGWRGKNKQQETKSIKSIKKYKKYKKV